MTGKTQLSHKHQKFVDLIVRGDLPPVAYRKVYPKCTPKSAATKSGDLLKKVEISSAIHAGAAKVTELATQKAANKLSDKIVDNVLTAARKRQILMEIAEGRMAIPQKKYKWNPITKKVDEHLEDDLPDHMARMKAIDLDNRMSGDYAPEKWQGDLKGRTTVDGKLVVDVDWDNVPDDVLDAVIAAAMTPKTA